MWTSQFVKYYFRAFFIIPLSDRRQRSDRILGESEEGWHVTKVPGPNSKQHIGFTWPAF